MTATSRFEPGPQSRSREPVRGNAICALAVALWAMGFPAAEHLLASWDPAALIATRLALAVAALMVIWLAMGGWREIRRARWRRGMAIGAVGFGLAAYLILLAQSWSNPVSTAIIAITMPVVALALEALLDQRPIRPRLMLAVVLAVAGGLLASGHRLSDGDFGPAESIALLSVALFAWGSRAAVRELADQSEIARTAVTMTGALVFCGLGFAAAWGVGLSGLPTAPLDQTGALMLALYALGAMALSQLLWIIGIGRPGVALASIHMNIAPFYVMALAATLGEPWRWGQAAGAVLVGLGAAIAQRRLPGSG